MVFITVTESKASMFTQRSRPVPEGGSIKREATDDACEGQTPLKDRESRKSVPRTKLMAPDIAAPWAHCSLKDR